MKFKYLDLYGNVLVSNMSGECGHCINNASKSSVTKLCPNGNKRKRYALRYNDDGGVFLCSADKLHVRSVLKYNDYFKLRFELLYSIQEHFSRIKDSLSRDFSRLLHNLTSLNAHNSQELFDLLPQDSLTQNTRTVLKGIETTIINNPPKTARTLLQLQKNSAAIKTEFDVYRKLYQPDTQISKRYHKLHKVLLNVLYVFFQDFNDKHVHVNVEKSSGTGFLDYETFRVALFHIFQNATKYICPNTEMLVFSSRNDDMIELTINMISLTISDLDMKYIFDEGYSGESARELNLHGAGLGMFITKKALEINDCEFKIKRDISIHNRKWYSDVCYVNNEFVITIPRK